MSDEVVLEFENVTCRAETPEAALTAFGATVPAGGLVMLSQDGWPETLPLFDLASGLRNPDEGRVRFRGREWRERTAYEAARERGRIGRAFEGTAWVSNLDAMENVALAQRHHTDRPDAEIEREAHMLARRLGMAGVPACRTHLLQRSESRRLQWVRAFLGGPALVLLERPEIDVAAEDLARLASLMREARAGGAGILCRTDAPAWSGLAPELGSFIQLAYRDGRLVESEGRRR